MTAILAVVLSSVAIPMTAIAVTQPVQSSTNQPTGWPKEYNVPTASFLAIDDDKVISANCSDVGATNNSMTFSDYSGTTDHQTAMPPSSTSLAVCVDSLMNDENTGYAAGSDGSMYTNARQSDNSWHLEKYKSGIKIWDVALPTSPTNCSFSSNYPNHNLILQSMSIGADGNVYGILGYEGTPTACGEWLISFSADDGDVRFKIDISTSSNGYIGSRLWTYPSNLLVQKKDGSVHQFDFNGVEDTAKEFALTAPSGRHLVQTIADSNEGVYGIFAPNDTGYTKATYTNANGTSDPVNTPFSSYDVPEFSLGGDGKLVTVEYGNIYRVDVTNNTSTSNSIILPSGYTNQSILSYMEDTNSIGILVRKVSTNTSSNAIRVDTIDPNNGSYTNIFNLVADAGVSFNPTTNVFAKFSSDNIYGNNLYIPICYTNTGCTGNPGTQDVMLYKISLTGVGAVVSSANAQHAPYVSSKLNYVAMGDSYSSGEGNPAFNAWTNVPGTNQCHRSEDTSYPEWLTQHGGLNLNLSDYVACSGATTDTLLNGGTGTGAWNEPSQISALSASTDRVTFTIGGNDAGFSTVLGDCVKSLTPTSGAWGCSSDVTVTGPLNDRLAALDGSIVPAHEPANGRTIRSLLDLINQVADAAPNASIYVGGYPELFGTSTTDYDSDSSAPGGYTCTVGFTATVSYTDAQWINSQADDLDTIISNAVNAAHDAGVNVTYVPPALFDGHGLCDSGTPYLYGAELESSYAVSPGSMHPDSSGQTIAYGLMFQTKMS